MTRIVPEKRNPPGSAGAFTLIELLVVITVMAVLMALLFPAFRGVQDQAKRTQAKNDLTQIVTSANAFYTEYGRYPVLSTIGRTEPTMLLTMTSFSMCSEERQLLENSWI